MLKKLNRISKEYTHINPYWSYCLDEYLRPDGKIGEYYYVETPGSVLIIPISESGTIYMTKQFRYLNEKESIEFPGGGKKKDFTYLQAAKAELKEEIGGEGELELLGSFNPCNGITNEICEVFIGKSIKLTQANPDDSEEIEIVELSVDDIIEKIRAGEIWDGMTITAFYMFYVNYKK